MKKISNSIYLIIILSSFLIFNCQKQPQTIATVGKLSVSTSELLKDLSRAFPNKENFKDIDLEKKSKVLDNLIFNKLKVNEAIALGLDNEESYKKNMEEKLENLLLYRYYEVHVVDQFVSEEEINKMLKEGNVELKASHILIKYNDPKQEYQRTKEEAKTLAQFIANEAKNGEDFNHLVKQYSDDQNTRDRNGDLGYFKYGKMEDSFQKAVFNMEVGEISDPVETRYGFHIIRLDDRRDVASTGSDDRELYYRIKQQLFIKHRRNAQKVADSLYTVLREKYSYKIMDDNISKIAGSIKDKVTQKQSVNKDSFTDEEKAMILSEWDGGQSTIETLIDRLGFRAARILPQLTTEKSLQDFVRRIADSKLITLDAKAQDFENDEYIKDELEKFSHRILANLYESKYINKNLKIEESDIEEYYAKNSNELKTDEGEIPPLAKVKSKIKSKIRRERRQANNEAAKKTLSEKYPVNIDEELLAEL